MELTRRESGSSGYLRPGVCAWVRGMPVVLLLLLFSGVVNAQTKYATVSGVLNKSALKVGDEAVVAVVVDVAEGFHAQSHTPHSENLIPCTVRMEEAAGVEFGDAVYPAGKDETYPDLGVVSVYTGKTIIYVPLKVQCGRKGGGNQVERGGAVSGVQ